MNDYQSLNHAKRDCKFQVVWIPKYRKKMLYGQIRKELGPILEVLARQKGSEVVEGRLVADHAHTLISIPPKYAFAQVIGFLKGKSAIWVSRMCGRQRNFIGQNFWARGYCASTTGLDGDVVRAHTKRQEDEGKKLDQLRMFEE